MDTPHWLEQAACRGANTNDWYPTIGEHPSHARLICATCPVTTQCLTDAAERREIYGMWGGAAGDTLRGLREKFNQRAHPEPDPRPDCECPWCTAVTNHLAALEASRFDGNRFTRGTRRTDFTGRTHGQAATYNIGCRCPSCRLAKTGIAKTITATTRRTA